MSFSLMQILGGFIAPAVLIALVGSIARKFVHDPRWIFGPLIAIAFAMGYRAIEPAVGWPPNGNVVYLLFYLPVLAGILTLADSILKPPLWFRALVLVILWRLGVRLVLGRQIPNLISPSAAEMWIDFSTAVTTIWWLTFEGLADRAPGITTPLLLSVMSGAIGIELALAWHIQTSGALAGVVALIALAGIVPGAFRQALAFSRGFAQMAVLILQLLLVHGYFYTGDPLTPTQQTLTALLLTAPLLALLGDVPAARRLTPRRRLAIRLIPAMIAVAIVCGVTIRDFARAQQNPAAMQEE